jgi:hypothetical protein
MTKCSRPPHSVLEAPRPSGRAGAKNSVVKYLDKRVAWLVRPAVEHACRSEYRARGRSCDVRLNVRGCRSVRDESGEGTIKAGKGLRLQLWVLPGYGR